MGWFICWMLAVIGLSGNGRVETNEKMEDGKRHRPYRSNKRLFEIISRDRNTLDYSRVNIPQLDNEGYKFDFSPRRCVGCRETKPIKIWADDGPFCSQCYRWGGLLSFL